MSDTVNIQIKHNRDGSPYTGGLFIRLDPDDRKAIVRKLEPGEIVEVPRDYLDRTPNVSRCVEITHKPASRPLTFPSVEVARASAPSFKPIDDETTRLKEASDVFLAEWQLSRRPAPEPTPTRRTRSAPAAEEHDNA